LERREIRGAILAGRRVKSGGFAIESEMRTAPIVVGLIAVMAVSGVAGWSSADSN
jgi:hypothetical protein